MKTPKLFLIITASLLFCFAAQSQQSHKKASSVSTKGNALVYKSVADKAPSEARATKTSMVTNCTDKINYVGTNSQYYVEMGGTTNGAITGMYQAFPDYEGSVIGVEFDAAKSPTMAGNPVVYVRIYDLNIFPIITSPLSALVAVTITNTSPTSYTVMFPSPVIITNGNGFAAGIVNSSTSSKPQIQLGVLLPNALYDYSFLTDVSGGTSAYDLPGYFNTNGSIDIMIRPIVSTTVNPSWVATKTSTGCALPFVYDFNNTTPPPSYYVFNPMISPGGIDDQIDFGDGSAPITFSGAMNSYTNVGNYIAGFTETYHGWTNDCVSTLTTNIQVDNPSPAFSYSVNGLSVTFNNTSVALNNFVWNFGDLTTSTQANPGTHTFNSPGTYVVELEGTAPCGTVRYSVSIVITGVGIKENKSASDKILIYPNPAQNYLTINNSGETKFDARLCVYNSLGELVKTIDKPVFAAGNTTVEVSDLPSGFYFIKLISNDNSVLKSFVKE